MSSSLWNKPVDDITFEDVVAFCADRRPEGVALEYKAQFSDKNPVKQIAKEVCAFANTRGGLILFGVDEAADRRPVENPTGQDLGKKPRDRILSACNEIWPPPAVEVSGLIRQADAADNSDTGFVVVNIPPSMAAPHAVESGTRVYIRKHDRSEPDGERFTEVDATVSEIEHMLGQRRQLQTLQRQRVDYSIDCMRRAMGVKETDPALFVAIGPVFGFEPRLTDADCFRLMTAAGVRAKLYSCGAYALIIMDGSEVVGLDRWGNAFAALRLTPVLHTLECKAGGRESRAFFDIEDSASRGEWKVVLGSILAGAVVRAVKIAQKANAIGGASEPIEARMIAARVCRTMISPDVDGLRSPLSLGMAAVYNPAEDTMSVEVQTRLEAEGDRLSRELVGRLFRAWGSENDRWADVSLSEFAQGSRNAFWS